jgi:hypothetical protein
MKPFQIPSFKEVPSLVVFCDDGHVERVIERIPQTVMADVLFLWPLTHGMSHLAGDNPIPDSTTFGALIEIEDRALARQRYDFPCPVCQRNVSARAEKLRMIAKMLHGQGVSRVSLSMLERMLALI